MGIAATFSILGSLPREDQVAFAETALREPYPELQSAAFDALSDPNRLNLPESVLQRFPDLLPEVREKLNRQKTLFASLAREMIRSTGERARRIGYEVMASLFQMDALPTLIQGIKDESVSVRERVADLLESLALKYHYRLSAYHLHGDPASRKYLEEHRAVMLQGLEDLLRTYSEHGRRIFLDITLESGAEAYPLITNVVLARPRSELSEAFIRTLSIALTDSTVDLLFRLLQERTPALQDAAREAMAGRRDPAFAALIVGMLARLEPNRFASLAGRTTEVPWWGSVEVARKLDPLACIKLIDFLGKSGLAAELRQTLILSFMDRSHPEVRAHVLSTLKTLGTPNALNSAVRALEDPSDAVKLEAAKVIMAMNPPDKLKLLTPLLNSESPALRELVAQQVSPVSFARYVEAFDRLDPATRELAARALSKIDADVVERLTTQINSLEPERRLKALRMVQLFDAEENLRETLLELLADPDRRVRATTLRIIHLSRNVEGIKLLATTLRDPDARVRANAIEAFEDIGDPSFASILEPFLEDPDNRSRANAAKALLALGRPEARSVLEAMLADDDENRRISAVWAIAEARFGGAADALRKRAAAESSEKVRARIEEALERMDEPA